MFCFRQLLIVVSEYFPYFRWMCVWCISLCWCGLVTGWAGVSSIVWLVRAAGAGHQTMAGAGCWSQWWHTVSTSPVQSLLLYTSSTPHTQPCQVWDQGNSENQWAPSTGHTSRHKHRDQWSEWADDVTRTVRQWWLVELDLATGSSLAQVSSSHRDAVCYTDAQYLVAHNK